MTSLDRIELARILPGYQSQIVEADLMALSGLAGDFRSSTYTEPRPLVKVFNEALSHDISAVAPAIGTLINAELRPEATASDTPPTYFDSVSRRDLPNHVISIDHCTEAELHFATTYQQIMDDSRFIDDPHPKIGLYHSADGTPLLLRKSKDVSTGLTLAAFHDERTGLDIPPGTIVGVGPLRADSVTGDVAYATDQHTARLRTILFDPQRDRIRPLRLSPWAFDDQRNQAIFAAQGSAKAGYIINKQRLDTILDHSVSGFRNLGAQVFRICQTSGCDVAP